MPTTPIVIAKTNGRAWQHANGLKQIDGMTAHPATGAVDVTAASSEMRF